MVNGVDGPSEWVALVVRDGDYMQVERVVRVGSDEAEGYRLPERFIAIPIKAGIQDEIGAFVYACNVLQNLRLSRGN
jgi:hypothetical protein